MGFRDLDFRPTRKRLYGLKVPSALDLDGAQREASLGRPRPSYRGPSPPRGCEDLLSGLDQALPGARDRGAVLDLGCGPGDAKASLASMGFDWVGVDLPRNGPSLFADAHSLPFRDEAFSAVFSLTVLEHLHNPFIAVAEVGRVLAPGAPFVGVAAFGEPFHASFFHASAWGLVSLLSASGFTVRTLWPCRSSLAALGSMGGYPRAVRALLKGVASVARLPMLSPRTWLRGDAAPVSGLTTAGSIGFVALRT